MENFKQLLKPWLSGSVSETLFGQQILSKVVIEYDKNCRSVFEVMDPAVAELTLLKAWSSSALLPDSSRLVERFLTMMTSRKLFQIKEGGHFGIAPGRAQENDLVVILHGGRVPFLLRKSDPGYVTLVGPVHVHGTMRGEFLRRSGRLRFSGYDK